ncbi:MAG: Hpt domain-containing protein [Brevundimonas sp.]
MARRDLTGAVDFAVLDRSTGGDDAVAEEILELFVEQAGLWSRLLDDPEAQRDACHTIRGTAAGLGAHDLAEACAAAELDPIPSRIERVRDALDRALADVAAWRHELMLKSLKS